MMTWTEGVSVALSLGFFVARPLNAQQTTNILRPLEMERLPIGSVRPEGWLKFQLGKMTDGLCGRLYEFGRYLHPKNGWVSLEEEGEYNTRRPWAEHTGWEEQPCWFRSFVKLAILTGNERMLGVCRDWIEKILLTREKDGWYGPRPLKRVPLQDGTYMQDVWGHMMMTEALLTWYEFSGDGSWRSPIFEEK